MSSSSQTAFRSRSKTLPLPARVKIEKKIVQEPKTRSSFPFRRLVRLSVNCKYVRCIVRGRVKEIKYHATIYCFSGACVHLCLAVIHSLICVFYSRLFYHCFIKVAHRIDSPCYLRNLDTPLLKHLNHKLRVIVYIGLGANQ